MPSKNVFEYFKEEKINIGINLGNSLDAVNFWDGLVPIAEETVWRNPPVNQAYFKAVREHGFNIVRIPVTWLGHTGTEPDHILNEPRLRRVAEVVNMAHNAGLKVIINIHHDSHYNFDGWLSLRKAAFSLSEKEKITNKLERIWSQIADCLKDCGEWLMFEAFNNISDGNWDYPSIDPEGEYGIIKYWNQVFSNTIRAAGGNNEKRYLIFSGYGNKPAQSLPPYFELPEDPTGGRQIVSINIYEPWLFATGTSHQWDLEEGPIGSKAYFDDTFKKFKQQYIDKNIPVIIGECGPFRYSGNKNNQWYREENVEAAGQNRLEYIDYVFGKMKEYSLVPIYWETGDYNPEVVTGGDPSLLNRTTGRPNSNESAVVIKRMMDAVKQHIS